MKTQGTVHWSKDFVEHMRTVHFALIVVSSALVIAGSNNESARYATALTQIQQIAKVEHEWSNAPNKLYSQVVKNSDLVPEWHISLIVRTPKRMFKYDDIGVELTVPESLVAGPQFVRSSNVNLPRELSSLSDFRNFWNMLHAGVSLMVPEHPDAGSLCKEFIRVEYRDGRKKNYQECPARNTSPNRVVFYPSVARLLGATEIIWMCNTPSKMNVSGTLRTRITETLK